MARKRAHGEGTIRKRVFTRQDGSTYTRWFARVTTTWDGKKQSFKDGPIRKSQQEAKTDLRELTQQLAKGTLTTQRNQRLGSYLESWLETVAVTKKYGTYRSYYQSIHTYILPRIGHMRLDKIRKTHIQEMANDIFRDGRERSKDGKATVRKAVAALRKALGDAIKQDLLPSELKNPASDVEVPSEQNRDINIWTPYQTKRLLAVARHTRHFAILYTALTSGMREGELCGLKWSDLESIEVPLNGERRRLLVINIRRELVVVPKRHQGVANLKLTHVHGQYFFDTPKTKKSLSKVLVAEDTLEILEKHRVEQEEVKHELAGRYYDYDLVFPATTGVPQSPRNLLRDYKKILYKARIPELNFHDLRDSHSSLLQGLGKELAVVSERLRHSRKSTTADRYTHALSSSRLEGAVTMRELLKLGRSDR